MSHDITCDSGPWMKIPVKIEGGLRGERLVSAVTVYGGPNVWGLILYLSAPARSIYAHYSYWYMNK